MYVGVQKSAVITIKGCTWHAIVGKTHKKVLDVKCTEAAAPIKSQVHYSNFYCRQHLPAFFGTYSSEYSCCSNARVFSLNQVKNSNRPATNKNSMCPKAFVVLNTRT